LDHYLSQARLPAGAILGFEHEVNTHTEAAACVASGDADAALGVRTAAERAGLGFVPLFNERYDLVMSSEIHETQEATRMLDRLHERSFRKAVNGIAGYDSHSTGEEFRVAV
jgi:putative molybdopterin biosynthesis protein